jgi:Gas vesicle protein
MTRRRAPHSTVPSRKPATTRPRGTPLPHRRQPPHPPARRLPPPPEPRTAVPRLFDTSETSLADVIDNLLNRGVVLNADLILALADIDLVYVRLSALLCAADRVLHKDA